MKKIVTVLLGFAFIVYAHDAQAQNSPKHQVDTSKAWKKRYQPVVVPDPPVTGPLQKTDTQGVYNNRIYENGIKSAEYQNRGAEDRRNINTADPNAIPNKQVPANEVLPPKTVK